MVRILTDEECLNLAKGYCLLTKHSRNSLRFNSELWHEAYLAMKKADEEFNGLGDQKKFIRYRAILKIREYRKNYLNRKQNKFEDDVVYDRRTLLDIIGHQEVNTYSKIKNLINSLLENCAEKQSCYIYEYYINYKTFEEIARENNISRQAVQQTVTLGIDKIREKLKPDQIDEYYNLYSYGGPSW